MALRGQERPMMEVQSQWQMKAQASRKEIELDTMKRAYEKQLVEMKLSFNRRLKHFEGAMGLP